jgi:hypothetical protein
MTALRRLPGERWEKVKGRSGEGERRIGKVKSGKWG